MFYEGKEGRGHFLIYTLKPLWLQNESEESTFVTHNWTPSFSRKHFLCLPMASLPMYDVQKLVLATKKCFDGATRVFLSTWGLTAAFFQRSVPSSFVGGKARGPPQFSLSPLFVLQRPLSASSPIVVGGRVISAPAAALEKKPGVD